MATTVQNINKLSPEDLAAFRKGDPRFVYIGRAGKLYGGALVVKESKWANKHDTKIADICKQRKCGIREGILIANELYRADILASRKLMACLPELKDKVLLYYFSPSHADILIELLEQTESK